MKSIHIEALKEREMLLKTQGESIQSSIQEVPQKWFFNRIRIALWK